MVNHSGLRGPHHRNSKGVRGVRLFGLHSRMWLLGVAAVLIAGASISLVVVSVRDDGTSATAGGSNTDAPGAGASSQPASVAQPTSTATVAAPSPSDCSTRPSACGFPDATNTGVPRGTALTVINGDLTVSTAGAVIEDKDIRGCVTIQARNVTIRRSKVTCADTYGIGSFLDQYSGGGLLIEDVEVDCENSSATAIADYGVIGRRLNLHNCENGFDINDGVTVVDSYIHDMRPTDSGHTDGIQLAGGADIVIRHNTIFNPGGTSAIISHPNRNANVTIEANLLGGGAYTLYCPRESSTNFRVIDNRFSTYFSPKGGAFGPWDECEKVAENRGNVWDGTLMPVT